jgi:ribosomal RNA-processing protein 9
LLNQWKSKSKSKSKSSHSNQNEILASAISSDGKYCAVGGRDKTIKIFDLASNVEIKSFVGHRDAITSLCFKHNSHSLFSSSLDRCIKHWDLKEMGYLETLFGHQVIFYLNFLLIVLLFFIK